jgi:molecular chaperone Hsp33
MSSENTNTEVVRKYLSRSGTVRVSCVLTSRLMSEMQSTHVSMSPLASVAMGRTIVAASLLASQTKNGKTGLHFQGNGPLGELFVEASFEGEVRGYIRNPQADLALQNGKIDVSGGIGIGLLNVVRSLPYQKQPFNGTVMIKSGEIGTDIAYYLEQSHQIPSVVAIGEIMNEYGLMTNCGGIIIELMPGHTEKEISQIEQNVKDAEAFSQMIQDGKSEKEIVETYLKGIELSPIEHEHELHYSCTCSMEKVESSMLLLPLEDLEHLTEKEESVDAKCEFCGKNYKIPKERMSEIINDVKKKAMH